MAKKSFDQLETEHRTFIQRQHMFFVATAASEGRVNVAPKGMDTLRVIDRDRIIWLDLTGAENESAAHLLEVPRMTLMWCSFDRNPLVLRVYGDAVAVHARDAAWRQLIPLFPSFAGTRQLVDLHVNMVLMSCGFGVPLFEFVGQRDTLRRWAETKGEDGVKTFWKERNQWSLDHKPTGLLSS
jgi:predicted pyridoxine 5'-phosphate oxidase superfamily flavin-nucleotide-binding protein